MNGASIKHNVQHLCGKRILVTHTAGKSDLCAKLENAGASVIHWPIITIVPKAISQFKQHACYNADIWIFLSRHSHRQNTAVLQQCYQDQQIIAVGPATAEHLTEHTGLSVNMVPSNDFSTAGIASLACLQAQNEKKVLIFSESNKPLSLIQTLKKAGHEVQHIPTYQQQPVCPQRYAQRLANTPAFDYITTHSKNGLLHLLRCMRSAAVQTQSNTNLLVTTPAMSTVAKAEKKVNFNTILCSPNTAAPEIYQTLVRHEAENAI